MGELRVDSGPSDELGFVTRMRPFLWGFASQAASSSTSFGLSLLAAIVLGPPGLGRVFVGFSAYLIALGFQRALILDPLVSASSTHEGEFRTQATRAAFTVCVLWSGMSTAVLAAVGIVVPGEIGDGLILFVPWLVPALVQDFWRVVLFREGLGKAAALNNMLWVAVMALTIPLALSFRSAWVVLGTWGLGALASMAVGFVQTRLRPYPPIRSVRWWRRKAWPLGRWLGAEGIVYTLGSQGVVFVLALILGTRTLGGLRAVQTLFVPLSLLGPAIALPGLPELSRLTATSAERARRFALLLGVAAASLTGGYVLLAGIGGSRLIGFIFGEGFGGFASLIWPVAVGQLVVAFSLGFGLLLKAQRRGKALLWTRVVGSGLVFGLSSVLAAGIGVQGAAWGMALGSAVNAILVTMLALRGSYPRTTEML